MKKEMDWLMNEKYLSLIIVNYKTKHLLEKCLNKVFSSIENLDAEVFVVDNDSKDGSIEYIKSTFPEVILIENSKNLGFAAANNIAIEQSKGKYTLLINTDAFVSKKTIKKTIKYMDQNPDCGVLGVKLTDEKGNLQPSARKFPTFWNKFCVLAGFEGVFPHVKFLSGPDYKWWAHDEIRKVDWVVGAYFLVKKQVFDEVGLFDERYFLYYEETDFCRRAKQSGWDVIFYPHESVIHLGGQSSKSFEPKLFSQIMSDIKTNSEQKYFWKNYGFLYMINIILFEIIWLKVFIAKNKLFGKEDSDIKIANAKLRIERHINNIRFKRYKEITYENSYL